MPGAGMPVWRFPETRHWGEHADLLFGPDDPAQEQDGAAAAAAALKKAGRPDSADLAYGPTSLPRGPRARPLHLIAVVDQPQVTCLPVGRSRESPHRTSL